LWQQVRFEEGPGHQHHRHLRDSVADGRGAERSLASVAFRHPHSGSAQEQKRNVARWGYTDALEYHVANKPASFFYQEHMGYRPAAVIAIKRL
jgi:hypothetical protein